MCHHFRHKLFLKILCILYGLKYLYPFKLIPGRGYYPGLIVMLLYESYALLQLFITYLTGTAEDYCAGMCDLVFKKLSEVFQIGFALLGINHRNCAGKIHILGSRSSLNCPHNVRKLTYSRRLDKYPVRSKSGKYLL